MRGRLPRLARSALVVGLVALAVGGGTHAAFSGTSSSEGNLLSSGTVVIADNDGGGALLTLADASPGDSATGCILVTYSGTLDAEVRIRGAVAGSLAPYLTLTIERGTQGSPTFPSCAGFTPAGTVYSGTLAGLPSTWATGVADGITWSQNDEHVYRFTVELQSDPAAQGLSASADFTWEARNL